MEYIIFPWSMHWFQRLMVHSYWLSNHFHNVHLYILTNHWLNYSECYVSCESTLQKIFRLSLFPRREKWHSNLHWNECRTRISVLLSDCKKYDYHFYLPPLWAIYSIALWSWIFCSLYTICHWSILFGLFLQIATNVHWSSDIIFYAIS